MKYYRSFIISSLILLTVFSALQVYGQTDRRLRLARTFDRAGDYPSALELYLQLYRDGKVTSEIIAGIERNYRRLQKYDALIGFFEQLVKKNPQQFSYQISLAGAYYLADQKEKAFALWQRVYETPPQNALKYRLVARAMTDLHLYDQAITVYQKALERFPDQATLYRDMAVLYRARLNYEQATENYLKYYLHSPKQNLFVRSQLLSMAKDQEVTRRIIQSAKGFLKKYGTNDALQEMMATLYMRAKDYEQAFRIYSDLNKASPRKNYLVRFASQAVANRAFEYAVRAYLQLLKEETQPARKQTLQLQLAETHFRYGLNLAGGHETSRGNTQVQAALELLTGITLPALRPQALELMGDIYLRYYNDLDRAAENYQKALKLRPDRRLGDRLHLKLADVHLKKNELSAAEVQLKKVRAGKLQNVARVYLADLHFYRAQFDQALKAYKEILMNSAPEDTLYNNVLQQLTLLETYGQDSTALREFSQARLLEKQQHLTQAAEQYLRIFNRKTELGLLAAENAVRLFLKLKKWAQAEHMLREWIEKVPDAENIDLAYFWLAHVLQEQGEPRQALDVYQKILIAYPNSFYVDQARQFARRLSEELEREQNEN